MSLVVRLPSTALCTLLLLVVAQAAIAAALHADIVAVLVGVVDGDTIRVKVVSSCSPRYSSLVGFYGRVRLADINAPELSIPEGLEAKKALESLLAGHRIVYIDVDDLKVFDRYGRIVGVVLVDYNSTTLLNVNEWLLLHGYAEPRDYPNEFHPDWPLYIPRREALAGCIEHVTTTCTTLFTTVTVTRVVMRSVTVVATRVWEAPPTTITVTKTSTVMSTVTLPPKTITVTVTQTITTASGTSTTGETITWLPVLVLAAGAAGYMLGRIRGR